MSWYFSRALVVEYSAHDSQGMRELLRVVRPGAIVLDPFMGSGTTGGVAAL